MAKTPKSPRQFIFIDDSGDPGISLTKGASRYFIISAISFSSQNDLELATQEILKSLLNLPISYANIYIDGKSGKSYQKKIRAYFRQNLPKNSVHTLKYIDSKSNSLIQLADMISGATMEYYTTKRQQYLAQIYDKLNFSS